MSHHCLLHCCANLHQTPGGLGASENSAGSLDLPGPRNAGERSQSGPSVESGEHNSVYLADAHVRPRAHVVRLEVERLLVCADRLSAATAVRQRRAQLIPQAVVGRPHLQGRAESGHRAVKVAGKAEEHAQRNVNVGESSILPCNDVSDHHSQAHLTRVSCRLKGLQVCGSQTHKMHTPTVAAKALLCHDIGACTIEPLPLLHHCGLTLCAAPLKMSTAARSFSLASRGSCTEAAAA